MPELPALKRDNAMRQWWYPRPRPERATRWARGRRPITGAFAALGYGVLFAAVIVVVLAIRAVPSARTPGSAVWQSQYSPGDIPAARFARAMPSAAR